MTSFAFIFGVLPLVVATGAGAEMRRSLGVAVFSGMLGVTLFGIFLTPVFFYVLQGLGESQFFLSARVKAVVSYVMAGGVGAASGYLLAQLGVGRLPWAPLLGATAGILLIRVLREFARLVGPKRAGPGNGSPPLPPPIPSPRAPLAPGEEQP